MIKEHIVDSDVALAVEVIDLRVLPETAIVILVPEGCGLSWTSPEAGRHVMELVRSDELPAARDASALVVTKERD